MGRKSGLKHKKRQDISKTKIRNYHLEKKEDVKYMNIKKKSVGSNKYIKYHRVLLHYNIRKNTMSSIGYVAVRHVQLSCS